MVMDPVRIEYAGQQIGLGTFMRANDIIEQFNCRSEEAFTWVQEVLIEARNTFETPDITLLPKTPSAKRNRKQIRRGRHSKGESDEEDSDETKNPKKRVRPVRGQKGSTNEDVVDGESFMEDSASARPKRNTRATKPATDLAPRPTRATRAAASKSTKDSPAPPVSNLFTSDSVGGDNSPTEGCAPLGASPPSSNIEGHVNSPLTIATGSPLVNKKSPRIAVSSPRPIPGFSGLNIKQKATLFESFHGNSTYENQDDSTHDKSRLADQSGAATVSTPKCSGAEQKSEDSSNSVQMSIAETPESQLAEPSSGKRNSRKARSSADNSLSRLSGVNRKSISKKRSSVYRHLRKSMERHIAASAAEEVQSTSATEQMNEDVYTGASTVVSEDNSKPTSLSNKRAKPPVSTESDDDFQEDPVPKPTRTRSKMRKPKEPPKLEVFSSCSEGEADEISSDDEIQIQIKPTTKPKPLPRSPRSNVGTPTLPPISSDSVGSSISASGSSSAEDGTTGKIAEPASESSDMGSKQLTSTEPPRKTRSKMRVPKEPPKLPVLSDEEITSGEVVTSSMSVDENTPNTPVAAPRTTRSKIRHKPPVQTLPAPSSDDEIFIPDASTAPPRSTRSKMRHWKKAAESPYTSIRDNSLRETPNVSFSTKRAKPQSSGSDTATPSKLTCMDTNNTSIAQGGTADLSNSSFCYQTTGGARIAVPVNTKSFLHSIKRNPTQPSNLNTVVKSFINRNTPTKVTPKSREEIKRKEIAAKQKEADERIKRKDEEMKRKAEEMKRKRLEKQKQVAARREEYERHEKEQLKSSQRKLEDSRTTTARLLEEKLREEREKQKHRDKKLQEAEIRRKHEETLRIEKQREKDREQREYEEHLARRKAEEEAERSRKLAEQRRMEEDRRLEAERERAREMERLQQIEEARKRQDAEERKIKEERERKEREQRERQERERAAAREKQRQEDMRKLREQELAKIREINEQEKIRTEEERRMKEKQNMSSKHNTSGNSSLKHNTTNNSASKHNTSVSHTKTTLNTTVTMESGSAMLKENSNQPRSIMTNQPRPHNPDSYMMTPPRKPVKKNMYENYDITDLNSEDSTDDEDAPRKKIPGWAEGSSLKVALVSQHYHPPDLDEIFRDCFADLDLNVMFKQRRPRFNKRTSSAIWDSPMMKPSGKPLYAHPNC